MSDTAKDDLLASLGDLSGIDVWDNNVLVGIYMRPKISKGGIHFTDTARADDRWQSKVGLIVKMGPSAFVDADGKWFNGSDIKLHDWIMFRASDGWDFDYRPSGGTAKVECRLLLDTSVKAKLASPELVW